MIRETLSILYYISRLRWFLGRDTRGTRLLRRPSHSARLCWNWCSVERNRRSRRGLDQPRWKPCTARTSRVKTTREFTHCFGFQLATFASRWPRHSPPPPPRPIFRTAIFKPAKSHLSENPKATFARPIKNHSIILFSSLLLSWKSWSSQLNHECRFYDYHVISYIFTRLLPVGYIHAWININRIKLKLKSDDEYAIFRIFRIYRWSWLTNYRGSYRAVYNGKERENRDKWICHVLNNL